MKGMKLSAVLLSVSLSLGASAEESAWVDISQDVAKVPTGAESSAVSNSTDIKTGAWSCGWGLLGEFTSFVLSGIAIIFH